MKEKQFKLEKRRDFGDLFNDTFLFIKYNFKNLAKGIMYYIVPIALLQGISTGILLFEQISNITDPNSLLGTHPGNAFTLNLILNYVFVGLMQLFAWTYTLSYIKVYKETQTFDVDLNLVWKRMTENFSNVFFASILCLIMTCLAAILLFFPGMYVGISLTMVVPLIIFGNKNIGEAISDSFSLVKGNWWFTFGFIFVIGLIGAAFQFVLQIPMTIYTTINGVFKIAGEGDPNKSISIIICIFQSCGNAFIQILPIIGIGIHYFNLKEQKESPALWEDLNSVGKQKNSEEILYE